MNDEPDSQRAVDAFHAQVDGALGGVDDDLDVGMLSLKRGEQRPPWLERRRYRQPQPSLEHVPVAGHRKLALLQGVDSAAGVLVQLHARIRELRPARASLEQLDAELSLQLADVPAEERQAHALRESERVMGKLVVRV